MKSPQDTLQELAAKALSDYHDFYGPLNEFGKETLQDCETFVQSAWNCLSRGEVYEALVCMNYAVAAEGDFCGWVDRRAYGAARDFIKDLASQACVKA